MSAPTGPAPATRRAGALTNPEIRRKAFEVVRRLRALPPGTTLEPDTIEWLAELVLSLANRVPEPQRARPRTSRTSRKGYGRR